MKLKKILFFTLFFLLSPFSFISLLAQPGWIQNYDPFFHPAFTTSYEVGNILLTEDGDYVVNGTCNKFNDWESYQFGYLLETDIEGNVIWAEIDSISASPLLQGGDSRAFAILPEGGYASVGDIDFDPSYILFRDSEGNITNEKLYYESLNYKSICLDHDNNSLIIAGSQSGYGAMLQKTDFEGNQVWRRIYTEFNLSISVCRTADGGYALGIYGNDFGIAKVDSEGYLQWYQLYDYNSQYDKLNSIIQTSDGCYLLCGKTHLP